jgi:hypothetical protein
MKLSLSGLSKSLIVAWALLVALEIVHIAHGHFLQHGNGVGFATMVIGFLIIIGLLVQAQRMGRSLMRVFDVSAKHLALADAAGKGA